jgi:carbamoyltransferase
MIIVSIAIQNHNASICILEDEKILLLLQEERVSRIKNDSSLPLKMLNCIQNYAKVIDYLCLTNIREEEKIYICDFLNINKIKVLDIIFEGSDNHHLYHASSAFYGSGFEESACLVIDGWGGAFNDSKNNLSFLETTSIYCANYPNNFTTIYKNLWYLPHINTPDQYIMSDFESQFDYDVNLNHHLDLGVMYRTVTDHIGYSVIGGQGKTMGLSAYGKSNKNIPNILCENSILSNMNLFLSNRSLNINLFPYLKNMDFQKKADLAYSIQQALEKIFLERIDYTIKKTNCKNIVFSGGCALNVVGNSEIKKNFSKINFYVDPISNDACQSFGAAKFYYHQITNSNKISKLENLYLGDDYNIAKNKNKIKCAVDKYNLINYN